MIEIRYLMASLVLIGDLISAAPVYAADRSEVNSGKTPWSCGASLLPCRPLRETATNTLPYWLGNAPQPIRASYTPAFPRTQR